MGLLLPSRLQRQPNASATFDLGHPSARNVALVWTPTFGPVVKGPGGKIWTATSAAAGTFNHGDSGRFLARGLGFSATASHGYDIGNVQPFQSSTATTVLAVAAPISTPAVRVFSSQREGAGQFEQINFAANMGANGGQSQGLITLLHRRTSGGVIAAITSSSSGIDGMPHCWISGNSTTASSGYIVEDGRSLPLGTQNTLSGTYVSTAQSTRIGNSAEYTGTDYIHQEAIYLIVGWDRMLSVDEALELSINPWQIFAPVRRRLYFAPAGGGAFSIDAQPGSFSITGVQAGLIADRFIDAAPGSYTLTGFDAGVVAGRAIDAQPGSYTLTGVVAGLLADRAIDAQPGSFTLTGVLADLVWSGPAGQFSINAEPGSFSITGTDAGLIANRFIDAATGSFTITGAVASPIADRSINAEAGSFTLTGFDAGLVVPYSINAEPGVFTLTGFDAGLESSATPAVTPSKGAGRSRRRYRLKVYELPDGTLVRGTFEQAAQVWRQIRVVEAEVTPRVDGKRVRLPKITNKPKILPDAVADQKMQAGTQLIDATPLLDFPHIPWNKIAGEFITKRKRRRKAIAMLLLH